MRILYMAEPSSASEWREEFSKQAPDIEFREWPDIGDPSEVRYIITLAFCGN